MFYAINSRNHSQKPNKTRDMIVNSSGDLPRIELFAREQINDWDVWGNETNKFNRESIQYELFK